MRPAIMAPPLCGIAAAGSPCLPPIAPDVALALAGVARGPVLARPSLFSSLKRRTSSSKTVPIPWLSRPGGLTEPSPFSTGFGLRLMSGERNYSIRVPSASAFDGSKLIPSATFQRNYPECYLPAPSEWSVLAFKWRNFVACPCGGKKRQRR